MSEKNTSLPAPVCLERTKMWTKDSAGWIPIFSWKWAGIQPAVWMAGSVERIEGLGTPTGSQPVQFLSLFLCLQPVKRKHTDKYNERQHNSTAVFLQRAEMKFFHLFSCAASENKGKRAIVSGKAKIFTCILLTVILCSTNQKLCKKNALILCYLTVCNTKWIRSLDDYNMSASWKW